MAGYTKNREQNLEIKYLRKVLGQVDNRIQLPASLEASALRGLLDEIEPTNVREVAARRPRWLSLQSGIAYAAAFALIVGLFYATKLYRPEIIDGGLRITHQVQSKVVPSTAEAPNVAANLDEAQANSVVDSAATQAPQVVAAEATVTPPAEADASTAKSASAPALGVGGGGVSHVLFEQDGLQYRWRTNDANDPDRSTPVSLEVINLASEDIMTQIDLPSVVDVKSCLLSTDKLILIGTSDTSPTEFTVLLYSSVIPVPDDKPQIFVQLGSFVDVKLNEQGAIIHHDDKASQLFIDGSDDRFVPIF